MNTASKGRRNEYKSIKLLESKGYYCVRSAASKGLFDIVAISPTKILLVQVKTGRPASQKELTKMTDFGFDYLSTYVQEHTRCEVHVWKDRAKVPEIVLVWP